MSKSSTEAPANPGALPNEIGPVAAALLSWWQQASKLLDTELEIMALEGDRVARSMVGLLIFSLLIGLLSLSLWFAILTQLILFIKSFSFSMEQALGLAMVANLIGIWWMIRRCRYYSRFLSFPATRRSLTVLLSVNKEQSDD